MKRALDRVRLVAVAVAIGASPVAGEVVLAVKRSLYG